MRRRLFLAAPSVAEVVRYAGGWLFDQVMAGWDVTAMVADHADARPLHILGASTVDLESALASQALDLRPQAIAVAADLYRADPRVRQRVLDTLDSGQAVTLWGDSLPTELAQNYSSMQHRLSAAARAFKAQALVAASVELDSVGATETFCNGGLRRVSGGGTLVSAS